MISLIVAFLVTITSLWWKAYQHSKRIDKTRSIYKSEGAIFPFELMADLQREMLFHKDRFLESEKNPTLKNERIELLKNYRESNRKPLKLGGIAFLAILPIETIGWILIQKYF